MSRRLDVIILSLLLAAAVPGCFTSEKDANEETDGNTPPVTPGLPPTGNWTDENLTPPIPSLPRNVEFTNCTYQAVGYDWPTAIAPGETPPGWEPPLGGIWTTYVMKFMECGRVAWGPFERPLTMLFETHNIGVAPDECNHVSSIVDSWILHRIWLDDEEMATYLSQNYGIPSLFADVSYTDTSIGAAVQRTWSFAPASGGIPSTVVWPGPVGTEAPSSVDMRFVWWNGTMMGFLDMPVRSDQALRPGLYPTEGSYEAPSLMAETGVPKWAHIGNWLDQTHISSDIYLWADTGCTEPL
jgi:hypothetical protein